jgi:hypothetical protein
MNLKQLDKRALTPREAAQMYGLSAGTLANYRSRGVGPKYYRVPPGGRKVIYFVTDIESWLMRNPVLTYDTHE